FFFIHILDQPKSKLFPYTTLFRSLIVGQGKNVVPSIENAEFSILRRWLCFVEHAPPRDDSALVLLLSCRCPLGGFLPLHPEQGPDRKSTRLNSSHVAISYAVFCLK